MIEQKNFRCALCSSLFPVWLLEQTDEKPQVLEARTLYHCLSVPSDILVWKSKIFGALRALKHTLISFKHLFLKRGNFLGALLTYMVV